MYLPVYHHHPRNSSAIVLPTVTLLLPPLLHYDLVWADLVLAPQVAAPIFIEEYSLENVLIQRRRRITCYFRVLGTARRYSLELLKLAIQRLRHLS